MSSVHTVYLHVLYLAQYKQRLLNHIPLKKWLFITEMKGVDCAVRTVSLKKRSFVLKGLTLYMEVISVFFKNHTEHKILGEIA
jgi:hypothetical protein